MPAYTRRRTNTHTHRYTYTYIHTLSQVRCAPFRSRWLCAALGFPSRFRFVSRIWWGFALCLGSCSPPPPSLVAAFGVLCVLLFKIQSIIRNAMLIYYGERVLRGCGQTLCKYFKRAVTITAHPGRVPPYHAHAMANTYTYIHMCLCVAALFNFIPFIGFAFFTAA